jgi:hypothetical protein
VPQDGGSGIARVHTGERRVEVGAVGVGCVGDDMNRTLAATDLRPASVRDEKDIKKKGLTTYSHLRIASSSYLRAVEGMVHVRIRTRVARATN